MNNVFGLDIGTRNVVGTVGYQTDDKEFVVTAQYVREHETRAMLDGQIHDIGSVAKTIKEVKDELEKQTGQPLEVIDNDGDIENTIASINKALSKYKE